MDLKGFFTGFLENLQSSLPGILGASAVLMLGWIVAGGIRKIVAKLLRKTDLDNKLFHGAKSSVSPEKFISKMVYYLIMLMVLLVVLNLMGVDNVLQPLQNLVDDFVGSIGNIVGAGIIGFAGYIIAKIASELVGFAGELLDSWSEKFGLKNNIDLGSIVKQVIFLIVFIPILIAAIDFLGIKAISDPAKAMLGTFMAAIPKIIVAAIIITVFYIGGKYISSILTSILKNLGIDDMAGKIGISSITNGKTLSSIAGGVTFFFLMFTGIISAVEKLEITQLTTTLHDLLDLSGHIFFGLIIMAIGNFIANIASNSIDGDFLKSIAKFAVLGLFLAIALRTMGIANDIINLAFGLTLGSIAVAFALSFGLGGREAAGKQMEHFLSKFRDKK